MVTTTRYIYDGTQYLAEADETDTINRLYTNEPDAYTHLISQEEVSTGETLTYHYDALGSTRTVTDETETVTDEFTYDAWGNRLSRTGTNDIPFQYVGEHGYYREDSTDSYYVMARTYQPSIGRWWSKDPLGGVMTISIFAYSDNNAFENIDPSGEMLLRTEEKETRGEKEGTFNVFLSDCGPERLREGCCCTDVYVVYKPTAKEKKKYKSICLPVYVRTQYIFNFPCPDRDDKWRFDKPKDKQYCWPENLYGAEWTDFPGDSGLSGFPCGLACAKTRVIQEFEGCAIGHHKSGKKDTIGCTTWSHTCDFEYTERPIGPTPRYPSCPQPTECVTTCRITRSGAGRDKKPTTKKHPVKKPPRRKRR